MTEPRHVLDASVLLAFLHREEGAEAALALFPRSVISLVNWTEVATKLVQDGLDIGDAVSAIEALGVVPVDFTPTHARRAAGMWNITKTQGLSLGDRC